MVGKHQVFQKTHEDVNMSIFFVDNAHKYVFHSIAKMNFAHFDHCLVSFWLNIHSFTISNKFDNLCKYKKGYESLQNLPF